jgi:ADP-heptose:LPS heptosyltransferase
MKFGSLLRRAGAADPKRQIAQDLVRSANAARDSGKFAQASALYDAAVRLMPHRGDLQVQLGNMLKEIGDFSGAEEAYRSAEARMPADADLALQMGHLFKSAGRLGPAENAYRNAQALGDRNGAAAREVAKLALAGWDAEPELPPLSAPHDLLAEVRTPGVTRDLFAHAPRNRGSSAGIEWRRLGRKERTFWGLRPVLRGVEAFRGFCISTSPILTVELLLNGQLIYRGPASGGYVLPVVDDEIRRKYVFNIWIDLSRIVHGCHRFEARALAASGLIHDYVADIVIAQATPPSLAAESDGIVAPEAPGDRRSLTEQINSRPSQTRSAGRALLDRPPRAILVQQADGLEQFVLSIPAIRRVRALFPEPRLIGLVATPSRDLAASLGLFDDLVVVDLQARESELRYVLPLEGQQTLAAELASWPIDMAIDLAEPDTSRLFLPLSGAPLLIGFPSKLLPELDLEFSADTHDKWNAGEIVPHAKKALALVEWLGVLVDAEPNLTKREGLDRARLSAFGIPADARFVILHAGARAAFSRWPHYLALAELLIRDEGLHVIMMANDASDEPRISDALRASGRFQLIHRRLDFDDFDALISFCSVFVGDDSGPKHLASLRGAKVVSVQTARNNWMEWGQDSTGFIVTRKVPCAGCLIQTDLEAQECGRDFVCLTAINAEEVLAAVNQILSAEA